MRTRVFCAAICLCLILGCRRGPGGAQPPLGQAEKPQAASRLPKADLGRATIAADGRAVAVARGASLGASAGTDIVVQGWLELAPDADFAPRSTVVQIVRTRPGRRPLVMDSAIGKVEAVADKENLYRFRAVLTVPKRPGTYRIDGLLRGKTFAEGTLSVPP